MTPWQETLQKLSFDASFMFSSGNIKKKNREHDTPLEYVNSIMQARYPGAYTVEEYFDSSRLMFRYRLKFANKADETFWLLQNS